MLWFMLIHVSKRGPRSLWAWLWSTQRHSCAWLIYIINRCSTCVLILMTISLTSLSHPKCMGLSMFCSHLLLTHFQHQQNGGHLPDGIFKWMFWKEDCHFSFILQKFLPDGPMNKVIILILILVLVLILIFIFTTGLYSTKVYKQQ